MFRMSNRTPKRSIIKRTAWLSLATMLLAITCISPSLTQAYPEPAIVPQSWDLNITYAKPQPIAVTDVSGKMQWYWYVTYKVVNNTGEDQLFVPEVQIATDAGDLVRSGKEVPSAVFFAIKQKQGNNLLESPNLVVGKLLQGEDFARESVIVWPAFEHDISELNLFISGLSGETTVIKNPQSGEPVIVRKVLMQTYAFPGDDLNTPRDQQTIEDEGKQWIMR